MTKYDLVVEDISQNQSADNQLKLELTKNGFVLRNEFNKVLIDASALGSGLISLEEPKEGTRFKTRYGDTIGYFLMELKK